MGARERAVICAWCGTVVTGELPASQLSHGICVPCATELVQRLPADYLRSISAADGTLTLFTGQTIELPPGNAPAA